MSQTRRICVHRRLSAAKRGNTILEGALCLTIFLMILFGIIDFGRMVFAYNFVSYAAREATRYAVVRGTTNATNAAALTTFVQNEAVGLNTTALTVTPTWTPDHTPGSTVQVVVSYTFRPIAPYVPVGPFTLSSTSKMLISQ
jgi:Flp pilus assembly protein TadG